MAWKTAATDTQRKSIVSERKVETQRLDVKT